MMMMMIIIIIIIIYEDRTQNSDPKIHEEWW